MTISTPSGRSITPVMSVVRKSANLTIPGERGGMICRLLSESTYTPGLEFCAGIGLKCFQVPGQVLNFISTLGKSRAEARMLQLSKASARIGQPGTFRRLCSKSPPWALIPTIFNFIANLIRSTRPVTTAACPRTRPRFALEERLRRYHARSGIANAGVAPGPAPERFCIPSGSRRAEDGQPGHIVAGKSRRDGAARYLASPQATVVNQITPSHAIGHLRAHLAGDRYAHGPQNAGPSAAPLSALRMPLPVHRSGARDQRS